MWRKPTYNWVAVLRMLAAYVGEDRFLKGVSIYLKKHTYKNSVTKDLWEGIQVATGSPSGPSSYSCSKLGVFQTSTLRR